jgi:hypothetical protein
VAGREAASVRDMRGGERDGDAAGLRRATLWAGHRPLAVSQHGVGVEVVEVFVEENEVAPVWDPLEGRGPGTQPLPCEGCRAVRWRRLHPC